VKPAFLITIDTEGDDAWAGSSVVSTSNAAYLQRFQTLCEAFGMKPTYLVNWEMARCGEFQELGRHVVSAGSGEIGMHLHAWSSPPFDLKLTEDDARRQPYLFEFPEEVMRQKIRLMTEELENTFEVPMISHRAGRWGLDARYARLLIEAGYTVDCSVTPGWSWAKARGVFSPGPDFRKFPAGEYFVDPQDIGRPGKSTLLELPMTILAPEHRRVADAFIALARKLSSGRLGGRPEARWLRPFGPQPAGGLVGVLHAASCQRRPYVELMLHSSELMPGGSPYFRDARAVDQLYENLAELFQAAGAYEPSTLAGYRARFASELAAL
jgi:hypothetical protein